MAANKYIKRRFQCTLGGSFKFWHVSRVEGSKQVEYRWGAIGSEGQVLVKDYSSAWMAEYEAEAKIKEKLSKGYLELTDTGTAFVPAASITICDHKWGLSAQTGKWRCIACGEPREPVGVLWNQSTVKKQETTLAALEKATQCQHVWIYQPGHTLNQPRKECGRCSLTVVADPACAHPKRGTVGGIVRCTDCGRAGLPALPVDGPKKPLLMMGPATVGAVTGPTLNMGVQHNATQQQRETALLTAMPAVMLKNGLTYKGCEKAIKELATAYKINVEWVTAVMNNYLQKHNLQLAQQGANDPEPKKGKQTPAGRAPAQDPLRPRRKITLGDD